MNALETRRRLLLGSVPHEYILTKEGVPPLSFYSNGKPLLSYEITGNTAQDGMPSPDNPVEIKGVGEKTENLLQLTRFNYGKNTGTGYMGTDVFESDGYAIIVKGHSNTGGGRTNRCSNPFILTPGEYTLSTTIDITGLSPYIQNSQTNVILGQLGSFTIESDVEAYLGFNVSAGADYDYTFSIMLNESSEPLPYEPYGYKIPVTCGGTAGNIYLDAPLMQGEILKSDGTISRADGTTEHFEAPEIPTLKGTNILTVGTEVQPSSVKIEYHSSRKG